MKCSLTWLGSGPSKWLILYGVVAPWVDSNQELAPSFLSMNASLVRILVPSSELERNCDNIISASKVFGPLEVFQFLPLWFEFIFGFQVWIGIISTELECSYESTLVFGFITGTARTTSKMIKLQAWGLYSFWRQELRFRRFPSFKCRPLRTFTNYLFCFWLSCVVLCCVVLCCVVLCCVVLYCIVLYCIVLYCIVLYCIVLYCIVLCMLCVVYIVLCVMCCVLCVLYMLYCLYIVYCG